LTQAQTSPSIHPPSAPVQEAALVAVQQVSRIYSLGSAQVTALNNLTLEVPQGVMAALKGRSGSGKTTLLNMIGGLDQPTYGDIRLFGKFLSQMSAQEITNIRRHRIGFVFQSFAIFPAFSALENVELMLRIAGIHQGRRERAMRSLEIVGLGPGPTTAPGNYPAGSSSAWQSPEPFRPIPT